MIRVNLLENDAGRSRREARAAYLRRYHEEHRESRSEYMHRYYEKRREQWRETMRQWRAAEPDAARLVREARNRAARKGIPFDLTPDDVEVPEFCPILGIKLTRGSGHMHAASPTLDRVDPTLGYVRGNVAVISHRANTIKNSGSAQEHERIAAWMQGWERRAS
jgi:hypothetical protein